MAEQIYEPVSQNEHYESIDHVLGKKRYIIVCKHKHFDSAYAMVSL